MIEGFPVTTIRQITAFIHSSDICQVLLGPDAKKHQGLRRQTPPLAAGARRESGRVPEHGREWWRGVQGRDHRAGRWGQPGAGTESCPEEVMDPRT